MIFTNINFMSSVLCLIPDIVLLVEYTIGARECWNSKNLPGELPENYPKDPRPALGDQLRSIEMMMNQKICK